MKENSVNILKWVKLIAIALYCILTFATCAGVWNFCPEPFVKWCAGFLFAANGLAIYAIAKNTMFKY